MQADTTGWELELYCYMVPVGSSKSTIVTALKKGLEAISRTDEGALYSFSWKLTDKEWDMKV